MNNTTYIPVVSILLLLAVGCGDDGIEYDDTTTQDVIVSAQLSSGTPGTYDSDRHPRTDSFISLLSTRGSVVARTGGSGFHTVSAPFAFDEVFLSIRGPNHPELRTRGHYAFKLPEAATIATIEFTLAPDLESGPVEVYYTIEGQNRSEWDLRTLDILPAGDDALTIEMTWPDDIDVDLSVAEPSGEVISHGERPISSSGGRFAVDDYGCGPDGREVVIYPETAPVGSYTVRGSVPTFRRCSEEGPSSTIVTLRVTDAEGNVIFEGSDKAEVIVGGDSDAVFQFDIE